jgi:hypothetical protein
LTELTVKRFYSWKREYAKKLREGRAIVIYDNDHQHLVEKFKEAFNALGLSVELCKLEKKSNKLESGKEKLNLTS